MAYLDHAATTPMLPEAIEAYAATARSVGNASSLHAPGRTARRLVEEARERIAAALGARPSEVIFTGGGTESDNLAVKGIFWARREAGAPARVLASSVEHHAVLDAVRWLECHEGADVTWLPVDGQGRVVVAAVRAELERDGVALVTCMCANNEVGTIQPVVELATLAAEHGVPLHTDAIQAIGQVPVDFAASGAAALTATGHKLGGPMGVGALLLNRDTRCTPLLHGGGQERDVRSGTLDVAGIVAFAVAVEIAVKSQHEYAMSVGVLRDELVARVRHAVSDAVLNGDPRDRLPGNAHF
ncbi:MAG: cysteine desulfurase family protein, partial [Micromonosporaceae bacterium]